MVHIVHIVKGKVERMDYDFYSLGKSFACMQKKKKLNLFKKSNKETLHKVVKNFCQVTLS